MARFATNSWTARSSRANRRPERWARSGGGSLIRHALLEVMPVGELAENFSRELGAPTKELYSMARLVFLADFFGWTAQEAVEVYIFRSDLQYALNLEPGVMYQLAIHDQLGLPDIAPSDRDWFSFIEDRRTRKNGIGEGLQKDQGINPTRSRAGRCLDGPSRVPDRSRPGSDRRRPLPPSPRLGRSGLAPLPTGGWR